MRLIAALACAMCVNAHAEFLDGNKLLQRITSGGTVEEMVALGYVMGVHDVGQGGLHCSPPNAQAGQMLDMTRNYLLNTPAERHLSADVLVTRALRIAFPCPAKSRGNPT
jgi:hypothetical protein